MKSTGMKRILGIRQANSDGFTYSYGKFKFNRSSRNKNVKAFIRADKKRAKAIDDKIYEIDRFLGATR